jgi:NADH dehydrogenase
LAGHPDVFVLGDMASQADADGNVLPGTAAVAGQQGRHVARQIQRRIDGKSTIPFKYRDLGEMATIGRASAVCHIGKLQYGGYLAWLTWLFLHLILLVGHENRVLVSMQWFWNYWTRNRSARLITGSRKRE